jgi:HPt (histidine-containing phosphotransfer) domain-containing protein
MSNPAIDLNELKEIMDNDMELIHDCFSDFINDMPQIYEEIKKAVLEKNAQELDASAHKLKGTLRYLAADAAANAAYDIEAAGKENKLKNLDDKLETLKTECKKVTDYINNFKF